MPERFLLVRLVALGDVICATTVVQRIRAEQPGAHITWLCGRGAEQIVRLVQGVDDVIVVDEQRLLRGSLMDRVAEVIGVWRAVFGKRFDTVIQLHGDLRYSVLLAPLVTARVLRAKPMGKSGGNFMSGRFRGDEWARLLDGAESRGPITKSYGLANVRDRLPNYRPTPTTPTKATTPRNPVRVVLAPGGARNLLHDDPLRRWPVESYRALAESLLAAGCEVELIGDSGDAEAARQFGGLGVVSHVGKTSLIETLCVMRDADVVVAHDSGPLHLSRFVGTPVVGLFGPTEPRHVVGEDPAVTILWGGEQLPCRPCYDGSNYAACSNNLCMKSISVNEVRDAVMSRVARA